jgi:hypothetical protein
MLQPQKQPESSPILITLYSDSGQTELAAQVEHANVQYSQSHAMKVCIESLLDLSVEQD